MGDKIFKTHDEQINILISRGVDISSPSQKSFAKKKLQHIGYYSLINGYNNLFLLSKNPEDIYKPGTTIDEIYSLYSFDKNLRTSLFNAILPFETNIKTLIAYYFSKQYGHDNYLLYKNFDINKKDAHNNITSVISEFQHQLSSRSKDPCIMHYLKKYGYVPFWVLNNVLTFGQISKFFAIMQQKERQTVSKVFHLQDNQLENILYYLSSVRNVCAHGNRLYCYRSTKPLIDLPAHISFSIPKSIGNEYDYGKRDLFGVYIALKYVMSRSDYNRLVKETDRALSQLRTSLSVVTEADILKEMGFPSDWKSLLTSK